MAENEELNEESADWAKFVAVLNEVTFDLAMKIVNDGEGITRTVTINVKGAVSDEEADLAGRAVANSMLNKTAWAGTHPNWGRVMDALGYSKAKIDEDTVTIHYDDVLCTENGVSAGTAYEDLVAVASKSHFNINIDLNLGDGKAVVYSCNCTEEYVQINV